MTKEVTPHANALTEILLKSCNEFYKLDEVTPNDILTASTSCVVNVCHNLAREKAGDVLDKVIEKLIEHRDSLLKDDQL